MDEWLLKVTANTAFEDSKEFLHLSDVMSGCHHNPFPFPQTGVPVLNPALLGLSPGAKAHAVSIRPLIWIELSVLVSEKES